MGAGFWLVVRLLGSALALYVVVTVVARTGLSRWWAVAVCVPGVNVVALVALAFVEWPVHRELDELRRRVGELERAR